MTQEIRIPFYRRLAIALLLTFTIPVSASTPTEIAKLLASDADGGEAFGRVLAVAGNTAVIGAPSDDDAGSASGSVYVFTRAGTTWTEQAKLTASDAAVGDEFGSSVAINSDTAVIGAPNDRDAGSRSGSVYVFTRTGTTWTEQAKLTASDAAAGDLFGTSVGVTGNTAVIGSPSDDDKGIQSGSVYVFMRTGTTWTEQEKLTANDGDDVDAFGLRLAITEDTLMVGAPFNRDAGTNSGSAYIFTRTGTTWTEHAKLTASDAAADDKFGLSLAVTGDTAVIGAVTKDNSGADSGSAYIFTRTGTTWTEQAKLTASDAAADDLFGFSVAIGSNTVVIGANQDDDAGTNSGSAYLFTRTGATWVEQAKLAASDADVGDRFGASVAITGNTVLVGADHTNEDAGTATGSVYVFSLVTDVDIDIKPGNNQNKINPRSNGRVWVAVLSDTVTPFDPLQIKIPSVRFGPGGAKVIRYLVRDVNKDGLGDLLLQFKIRRAGIKCGDTEAAIRGRTFDKQKFRGVDSVKTVGCK